MDQVLCRICGLAALLLMLSGCYLGPGMPPSANLPKVSVSGVVHDPQGNPVPKAQVWAAGNCEPEATNGDGKFHISARSPNGSAGVCVIDPVRSLGAIAVLRPSDTPANLTLQPLVSIEGKATTPAGLPADNLVFTMDAIVGHEAHHHTRQTIQTDAAGRFRATKLIPNASYRIFWNVDNIQNRDYGSASAEVNLAALKPGEPISIAIPKYTNVLIGTVVDPSGKPLAGAVVRPEPRNAVQPSDARRVQETQTDAQGSFTIPYLADGKLPLTIYTPGWRPTRFTVPTDDVTCRLQVEPMAAVATYRAEVVDEKGTPIPNAQVWLLAEHMGYDLPVHHASKSAVTDAHGIARFDGPAIALTEKPIAGSTIQMVCDAPGYDLAYSSSAQAGEDMDIRFTLTKSAGTWTGRVFDDRGQAVEGAKVTLISALGNTVSGGAGGTALYTLLPEAFSVRTDRSGRFSFTRCGQATLIQVEASAPGLEPVMRSISRMDRQLILERTAQIRGRIVLKGTGQPFRSAEGTTRVVFARDKGAIDAPVKSDGTFSTDTTMAGSFTAWMYCQDPAMAQYISLRPTPFSTERGKTAEVNVEVEPAGIPLLGTLRVEGASPLSEHQRPLCRVYAVHPGQTFPVVSASRVAADGSWKLYLPPGRYEIRFSWPGISGQLPVWKVEAMKDRPLSPIKMLYQANKQGMQQASMHEGR
jgi:Carboxypeptidase regulatory-like domain